ncbi:MAG: hypothetical protein ABSB82_11135 [Terriglobia bacterium]
MRPWLPRALLLSGLIVSVTLPARPWGNQAHQMVNALAVESLPEPLRSYFRARRAYFIERASEPDELGREDPAERLHHYTDADAYDHYPFPKLRRQFLLERHHPTAIERRNGDSIWQIDVLTTRMAEALRRHQWGEADRDALFAAHYACDLTQPLHTTQVYDGQMTRQAGIHSRFETELVNALKESWTLKPQPPTNEADLRARIFREFLASYGERDAVLAADRKAVAGRTYVDPQYFPAFEKLAGPLAEKRLESAVSFVSSLWYTAWVRAGKPALPNGSN